MIVLTGWAVSEGDKERLAQALYVRGYYNNMGIQDLEDITDPTYFANAIQGHYEMPKLPLTFGEDIGLSAITTLEEGAVSLIAEEEFEKQNVFCRTAAVSPVNFKSRRQILRIFKCFRNVAKNAKHSDG